MAIIIIVNTPTNLNIDFRFLKAEVNLVWSSEATAAFIWLENLNKYKQGKK